MRHLLFYSQLVDMPLLTILQAERMHHEETQRDAQWRKKYPFRSLFQDPPDYSQKKMPAELLNYGFCFGIVFFIFKMLCSNQPDCGLYWAEVYRENLSKPLYEGTIRQGEDRLYLNPLMDQFLILLIRMSQLGFSQRELSDIALLENIMITRPPETKSLSMELGLDSRNIERCRIILDSKMKRLQDVQKKWTRSIIELSLSSDSLNPMPHGAPEIQEIFEALKANSSDNVLIPMLFHAINSVPASFWVIIHHLAYMNDPKNVYFPSISNVMDLQKMNFARIQKHKCMPPITDFVQITPTHAEAWEGDVNITTELILYEQFVRSHSVADRSFEDIFISYRNRLEISRSKSNSTLINNINANFKFADDACPGRSIDNKYHEYSIKYFVSIGAGDYSKYGGYAHNICCWKEIHRTPSGGLETATFVFDPNNGLWQLEEREDIGAAIVNFICEKQMTSTMPKLYLYMTFFRGFN